MRKGKNDGKEMYRKKPFNGKIERNLNEEYLNFIEEFGRISKEQAINFLIDKFGLSYSADEFGSISNKNSELKIIVFCKNEELRRILIDLGNKGANLITIWKALEAPRIDEYIIDGHPVGLQLYEGELSPYWNDSISKFKTKRKEFLKKEKAIRGAIRLITTLEPIKLRDFYKGELPRVNERLLKARRAVKALNEVIDMYLNAKAIKDGLIGYPAKWGMPVEKLVRQTFKPVTQRSHNVALNERIATLVNELIRIKYSNHQAHTKTAKLLSLAFPHLYKDEDADLVRQRYYTYQKAQK